MVDFIDINPQDIIHDIIKIKVYLFVLVSCYFSIKYNHPDFNVPNLNIYLFLYKNILLAFKEH